MKLLVTITFLLLTFVFFLASFSYAQDVDLYETQQGFDTFTQNNDGYLEVVVVK